MNNSFKVNVLYTLSYLQQLKNIKDVVYRYQATSSILPASGSHQYGQVHAAFSNHAMLHLS